VCNIIRFLYLGIQGLQTKDLGRFPLPQWLGRKYLALQYPKMPGAYRIMLIPTLRGKGNIHSPLAKALKQLILNKLSMQES